ncbi:MAG: TetR/AcrR family transcriptional regulator [Pseudomonadota bacterium]
MNNPLVQRFSMVSVSESTSDSTQQRLLDAAEALFLENGLANVSLRAIVRAAGQKNQSALQYHFGGREGLIKAILERRSAQIDARRQRLIGDALREAKTFSLRDTCELMIRAPFLLCREDRSFRAFLAHFGSQLLIAGDNLGVTRLAQTLPSAGAPREPIREVTNALPSDLLVLRLDNLFGLGLYALTKRARNGGSFRGPAAELFFSNLVDQIEAALSATVSTATTNNLT